MGLFNSGERAPAPPAKSAATGTVAGLIAAAIVAEVVSRNPSMTPETIIAMTGVFTGFLCSLGNVARTSAEASTGLAKTIWGLFSWIG